MTKNTLLILLVGLTSIAWSQEDETQDFIKLRSGEMVYGEQVKYKARSFGKSHFDVDGARYEKDQVGAYQQDSNYFLKATAEGSYNESFYQREMKGDKISTYSITSTTYNAGEGAPGYGGGGGFVSTAKVGYYTKTYGSMRRINYSNLLFDLKDNPASAASMKEVNKIKTIQGVLIGAGVAAFIGGIAATANASKENELLPPGERDVSLSPLIFVGPIMVSLTLWIGNGSKKNKMNDAIILYNK